MRTLAFCFVLLVSFPVIASKKRVDREAISTRRIKVLKLSRQILSSKRRTRKVRALKKELKGECKKILTDAFVLYHDANINLMKVRTQYLKARLSGYGASYTLHMLKARQFRNLAAISQNSHLLSIPTYFYCRAAVRKWTVPLVSATYRSGLVTLVAKRWYKKHKAWMLDLFKLTAKGMGVKEIRLYDRNGTRLKARLFL